MISFIYSVKIINVVVPDSNIFWWIAASVAVADAVNPNRVKTLLANGLNILFIKGNPVFSNDPKNLSKNPPDCTFSCKWVFDNLILAD